LLRRIIRLEKDKVTGGWRMPYKEEYTSPIIIRMIKSRRMRWAGHVARLEMILFGKGRRKENARKTNM
jgi:hypothetical protein